MFLEISQNSQENTCAGVSFSIKLQALARSFIKKETWHRCFPVNFAKFPRAPFLTKRLRWLLLKGRSDFQTKGLKREKDLKRTAADRNSITISYINAIKEKRPFYRCFGLYLRMLLWFILQIIF